MSLSQRRLVNEGTVSLGNELEMSEGAKIENEGTFIANAIEEAHGASIYAGGGSAPAFVNTGTLEKTSAGFPNLGTRIGVNVENSGAVESHMGYLSFIAGGSSTGGTWNGALFPSGSFSFTNDTFKGQEEFTGATVTAQGVSGPTAEVAVRAGSLSIPSGESASIEKLRLINATLTGAGTLNVSGKLFWEKNSVMSGSGKTVVQSTASGELSGSGMSLTQRRLINEGTTALSGGELGMSEGARIENKSKFIANSEEEANGAAIYDAGGATPLFINLGSAEKTEGGFPKFQTKVGVDFENYGQIKQTGGSLSIQNPVNIKVSDHAGHESNCGDPVNCATGSYSEAQTDFAIGGRGVGLVLTRVYNAQAAVTAGFPGAFGYGWTNAFGDRLALEEGGKRVTMVDGSGGTVPFVEAGEGSYAGPAWSQDALSGSSESGFTLITPDQMKYRFSGSGRLESVTDRNGNETTLGYETGRLKTITDPASRQITLTYNGEGLVESAEDPMGHVVHYAYEGGDLSSVTMPGEESPRWQFKYDGSHRMTSMTDGRGGKTTNEYDGSNRVISQTDPANRTIAFEYAPFHTTITNEATGSVTDEWFTSNNQPYEITRGFGTGDATTERFGYDRDGHLLSAIDGNGHKTTYTYDEDGNRTSATDAEEDKTSWTYDETHDVVSMTTPRGEKTTITRDGDGNAETISRPGPEETIQTTEFNYNEFGELESVTDPLEHVWTYGYNGQGDRTAEADPLGDTRSLEYNEDSQLTEVVSPRGNAEEAEAEYTTMIELDPQGRPLKVTEPTGGITEYAYDGNGNLEEKTNANGHTTKYTYDADNELTKTEKPNGDLVETGYDGAGAVTSQTDGNEHTTEYHRNALGEPVEVVDPLSRKTTEKFDGAGNLTRMVDPEKRETTYGYDAANRLTGVGYSDGTTPDTEYEYDPDGNLSSMMDGTGESSYEYDQLDRMTRAENGHGDVVGYEYDLGEELTKITYPNGENVFRGFDEAGRLESVTDWLGGTTEFAYDPDSDLEATTFPVGTGNVDEYTYDNSDRMSGVKFKSAGEETLASLAYLRDKLGQVEKATSAGLPGAAELTYGYDENERLTEAGPASYEYDAAGNITEAPSAVNSYDNASQLENGTEVSYSYDELGERTKTTPASGPATTYKYDQAGNLISVERPSEGEAPAIGESLAYDGTELLASQTNGLTTRYLTWDVSSPLPLILDDGQNSYIYGPNGLPVEQISSGEAPTYLHHDQLGSTRMLTDAEGKSVGSFSFTAYGTLEASAGSGTTPMGFAGQYTDQQTGLQYLRARFYDPVTAQFLNRDPLGAMTREPYGYAGSNPSRYVDPSGMSCGGSIDGGPGVHVTFPNPVDCVTEAINEAAGDAESAAGDTFRFGIDHASLIAAPVVFGVCVIEPELCTSAAVIGATGTGAANGIRALTEPCFNFWSAEAQDLLVTFAAALPGGIFELTAGRAGPELSPMARRVLQALLDAPGVGAEGAHGAHAR
jgi:RHS repeat-associated protein